MKNIQLVILFLMTCITVFAQSIEKPNLIIIMTDEHNFRTLGCYRDLMNHDQAFVWGDGVKVETPNIDRIAQEGAICMNYYASSPVCTPSRASFVSGLYPDATASYKNNIPMHDGVLTFAHQLKAKGYATSYVGKWHLDGDAKPGFAPKRKFGFDDNRYMFNRGHWKMIEEESEECTAFEANKSRNSDENSFTTDFLTSRALEIIDRDKNQAFCMMLSLPDPHGPNMVRAPYDTMYNNLVFEHPRTMDADINEFPKWLSFKKEKVDQYNQKMMQTYFGMVKCIDDNVGRILNYLKEEGLEENTIIVFTSDHGDLMGEHKRHNKGNPLEGSARIPFVLRYPDKVKAGKVIRKAYTSTDFTPTILGLMQAEQIKESHGQDASSDFLSKQKEVINDRITYMTGSSSNWTASVNNRYKLVLSVQDKPWLFDLEKDPDELINFYNHPEYVEIAKNMQQALLDQMKQYKDRALIKNQLILE